MKSIKPPKLQLAPCCATGQPKSIKLPVQTGLLNETQDLRITQLPLHEISQRDRKVTQGHSHIHSHKKKMKMHHRFFVVFPAKVLQQQPSHGLQSGGTYCMSHNNVIKTALKGDFHFCRNFKIPPHLLLTHTDYHKKNIKCR